MAPSSHNASTAPHHMQCGTGKHCGVKLQVKDELEALCAVMSHAVYCCLSMQGVGAGDDVG